MNEDSFTAYEKKYAEQEKLRAEILPRNKVALFGALKAVDVALLTVGFDGYGDEGQIQEIRATTADDVEITIPEEPIEVETADFDTGTISKKAIPIAEYVEELVYQLLRQEHEGWENNDGAYGQFKFEVGAGTIMLEYNERYTATEYYEHSF